MVALHTGLIAAARPEGVDTCTPDGAASGDAHRYVTGLGEAGPCRRKGAVGRAF